MAKNDNIQDLLYDVADAIREKKGTTEKINPQDFSEEIRSIEGGNNELLTSILYRSITEYSNENITQVGAYAFAGCTKLTKLHLPSLVYTGSLFLSETSLTELYLPKIYSLPAQCFQGAKLLSKVVLGENFYSHIPNMAFYACESFTTLIILSSTTRALGSSAFYGTLIAKGEGSIYVKDELVESYKAMTNWAQYGDQIKPLSEYSGPTQK